MRTASIWTSMMVLGAFVSSAAGSAVPPSSNVVDDPGHRFTIAVPANWKVHTSTSARAAAVSATSPDASGQLPASVDVITQDLPKAISPEGCADKATQVMRFTIHRWATLREGSATLAGLPAYSRSYVWRTNTGQERRSVQTCVTLGRRAFVVVGTTANTPSGVQDLPKVEHIMATFRPNTSNLPDLHDGVAK